MLRLCKIIVHCSYQSYSRRDGGAEVEQKNGEHMHLGREKNTGQFNTVDIVDVIVRDQDK